MGFVRGGGVEKHGPARLRGVHERGAGIKRKYVLLNMLQGVKESLLTTLGAKLPRQCLCPSRHDGRIDPG